MDWIPHHDDDEIGEDGDKPPAGEILRLPSEAERPSIGLKD